MRIIRKLLIFVFLSLIVVPIFGQRMKGRVKSYTVSCFSVFEKFGEIKKGAHLTDPKMHDELVTLDQNGNLIQSTEYNADGTVYARYKGKYDYLDNNIESVYVNFDPEITMERKPYILESVRYSWGEMCKMAYKINFAGHPVEETISDLMGREIGKISIIRNENGKSLEDSFSDGTVDRYKYDSDGNRTEWISRSPGGSTTITTYIHDASGNVIEKNINNFFKSTYKFHYDVYTYHYKVDKKGNWIERVDYENGKPQRLVLRTIEYAL